MEKRYLLLLIFLVACWSCQRQMDNDNGNESSTTSSFYEWDEYVLKQAEGKLFLQFVPTTPYNVDWDKWSDDWEKWDALINSDATLQIYGVSGYSAFLEAKDGNRIPSATIEYFMASPVVGAVSYPYFRYPVDSDHSEVLQGLRNEFVAKLKGTTSFAQLEQLAKQNHCTIREDEYVENQFFVTVPKTSELNAIQMSNLFYKTNLFESVQPTFVVLNLPEGTSCYNARTLKVLKDEPAIIREVCTEHAGQRVGALGFELANHYSGLHSRYIVPIADIPEQFRKEGLSVKISGNITSCLLGGCSAPNIRIAPYNLLEIKSIKIDN